MNSRELASAIYIELDADNWGDIEPHIFRDIAKYPSPEPGTDLDEHWEGVEALRAVLTRACTRLHLKIEPGSRVTHPEHGKGIFIEHCDCGEAAVVFCADDGCDRVPFSELRPL
jgi:hypothetical protein